MDQRMIELFAQKLASEVRDIAIESCDAYNEKRISPRLFNPIEEAKKLGSQDELVRVLVPFIVDKVISRLLIAIEGGSIPLVFYDESGNTLDLTSEFSGELSGWWGCDPEEWIGKYSNQRCIDSLKNSL